MSPPPFKNLTPTKGIVLNGKRYPIPGVQVLTWHEHGKQFRVGDGYNKRRRDDIDLAVWHWTGGEAHPSVMFETLMRRKYGIEFAIDGVSGIVFQYADPMLVDTADAGTMNARSVGIEMVNYGVKSWDRLWQAPKAGADRPTEVQQIHGKRVQVAAFRKPAVRAARALAEALSLLLEIPREVPRDKAGAVRGDVMSAKELAEFSGHLGHLHISPNKLDPGTRLLSDLFDPNWSAAA